MKIKVLIVVIVASYFLFIAENAPYRNQAINFIKQIKVSANSSAKDAKKSTVGFTKDLGI